jgi:hypothetical protein
MTGLNLTDTLVEPLWEEDSQTILMMIPTEILATDHPDDLPTDSLED